MLNTSLPQPGNRVLTRCGLLGRVDRLSCAPGGKTLADVVCEADGITRIFLASSLEVIVSVRSNA
jgi:hypothetical protein